MARLAGVSLGTVSAVLNDKRSVSEKSKLKVNKAISALRYYPSHVARSLRLRKTHTLGVIVPDITRPFFGQVLRSVEDAAGREGFSLLICDSYDNPAQERKHLKLLYSRRVDGILLASAQTHYSSHEEVGQETPVVFFDRVPAGRHGAAVSSANFEAMREATNYLIQLGHHDIALIRGRAGISTADERMEGYRQAMGAASLPVREEYLQFGDSSLDRGYNGGLKLMRLAKPPTAIIASTLETTFGLIWALQTVHVTCPDQVSILGFDDVERGTIGFNWAALSVPKLTAVAQFGDEMGREAVRLMMRSLHHREEDGPGQRIVRLKTVLRIRESTAPPRAARHNSAPLSA